MYSPFYRDFVLGGRGNRVMEGEGVGERSDEEREGQTRLMMGDLKIANSFGFKGGKFLKKLWCCIARRVYQGNLVLSTELIR